MLPDSIYLLQIVQHEYTLYETDYHTWLTGTVIAHPDEAYAKAGENLRDRPIIASYTHRVLVASHDEIESLAQAFNNMAGKILQREHDLPTEKQQMETMIQSLSDGVIAVDSEYRIMVCNASAQRITGDAAACRFGQHASVYFSYL